MNETFVIGKLIELRALRVAIGNQSLKDGQQVAQRRVSSQPVVGKAGE
jgi:hypothetical protein